MSDNNNVLDLSARLAAVKNDAIELGNELLERKTVVEKELVELKKQRDELMASIEEDKAKLLQFSDRSIKDMLSNLGGTFVPVSLIDPTYVRVNTRMQCDHLKAEDILGQPMEWTDEEYFTIDEDLVEDINAGLLDVFMKIEKDEKGEFNFVHIPE